MSGQISGIWGEIRVTLIARRSLESEPAPTKHKKGKIMARKTFNSRTFTTFLLAWTFLVLILSGIMLYVSPPGRIANWNDWRLLALTKARWQAVHTLTALVFLVGGLFHLLKFNWKVFLAYLRKRSEVGRQFGMEMLLSLVLFAAVLAGTLTQMPPFASVMIAGDTIKNSWAGPSDEPPMPHMEELSIQQVAERLQMEPEKALGLLRQEGLRAENPNVKLASVAKDSGRSPQQVYLTLQKTLIPASAAQNHVPSAGGSGLGIKTVAAVAAELGLTTDDALARLRTNNLQANPDDTIRTVASKSGLRPFEVVEILKQGRK
jgi:hypothetical protein